MTKSKIVTWDDVSIEPKSFKELSNEHKNFSIKLNNNTIENAFRHILNIEKDFNFGYLRLSENDFEYFKKHKQVNLAIVTSGYTAKYEPENSKLRFIFVEGGLEWLKDSKQKKKFATSIN